MTARTAVSLARTALRKPPRVVLQRALAEVRLEVDRVRTPRRGRRFTEPALLEATAADSVDSLWASVLSRPYPFVRSPDELSRIEARWPAERRRVLDAAERALAHEVDLLGTGPVSLGSPIDWHRDWKTGRRWPLRYGPRIAYAELDRSSDVKVPWEVSRGQWLLPAGQAYALTGDERYAKGAREVLDDWTRANPHALGVNWAIAMEPALRIFSWSWLLYAFGRSRAWEGPDFRSRLLRALYLHGEFVDRNFERSEVNGNHATADAAALAVAGLLLPGAEPDRWAERGWHILVEELPRQVHPDGVDFEASSAYHRLVGELFSLPALLRRAHGLDVPGLYAERLDAMGRFTEVYSGPDGLAPLWGDSDDARALPLGGQDTRDHRSLPVLAAHVLGRRAHGNAEAAWLVGPDAVLDGAPTVSSHAFPDGGVYVLGAGADHVFVDCGPVGLAGRGGHGHNDCLSFEATLAGERVVTDCGSYVYTASPTERNRFRSTSSHNTPRVDGIELNRIPASLWQLEDDAHPEPLLVEELRFRGTHTGYLRLPDPVRPVRTIALAPGLHALLVHDTFEAAAKHEIEIPFHLVPQLGFAEVVEDGVHVGGFMLRWRGAWDCAVEEAWVSPSYGVKVRASKVIFRRSGPVAPLTVALAPAAIEADRVWAWAEKMVGA